MDFTPVTIFAANLTSGRLELVEWQWPDMIDFVRTENDLMLEMSLAPYATDASAEYPEIAPGRHGFMGTLFVRYPGIAVHGRSKGGQIRVIRWVFSPVVAKAILRRNHQPGIEFLRSLLDIRSDTLRTLMRLAHRELTGQADRSDQAMEALGKLLVIELERLFDAQPARHAPGRLAGWQYNRIRDRLAQGGSPPTASELAQICGISARHLQRQFLALTGNSLTQYIENYWIERAKQMLAEQNMPIKSIAFACGFAHPNSFARAFRRATAMLPKDFRQRSSHLSATDATNCL